MPTKSAAGRQDQGSNELLVDHNGSSLGIDKPHVDQSMCDCDHASRRGSAQDPDKENLQPGIERLLRQYLASRTTEENLRQWFGRHTNDELRAHLAGELVAAVERDLPAGPVPHSVAD